MNARLFAVSCVVVITSGCTCNPESNADASIQSDGGTLPLSDGGTSAAELVSGVTPGAAYAFAQRISPTREMASTESRLYLASADAGLSVIERPTAPEALNLKSISKDGKYLYSPDYWQGVWRISDGARVVEIEPYAGYVIGETASGSLVMASEVYDSTPELRIVPLDGSASRLIADGVTVENTALMPNDILLYVNQAGLWRVDLKTSGPATRIDPRAASRLSAVAGTSFARVTLESGAAWVDLSDAANPKVTDLDFVQYGFLSPSGVVGFVRLENSKLYLKTSATATETLLHTGAGDLNGFNVFSENGLIIFIDVVGSTSHQYIAELKSPFEPIEVPNTSINLARASSSSRRAYLSSPYTPQSIVEIDFAARTASTPIAVGVTAVWPDRFFFVDPSSKRLKVKHFGMASTDVSTQRCWLLNGTGELGLHQCADRALYRIDAADRPVRLAGIEASDGAYDFAASGDLIRYYQSSSADSFVGGSAWLVRASNKQVLLAESESHFYRYRFGPNQFVREVGEPEDLTVSVYSAATGTETRLGPTSVVQASLFPTPLRRDGGAHLVFNERPVDAGASLRLYDLGANTFVPVADAGAYSYASALGLERFVAAVNDAQQTRGMLEWATGKVVPFPSISDGGVERFLRDTRSPSGTLRYLGELAVYNDALDTIVELPGFKSAIVDRDAKATFVFSTQTLSDGGTAASQLAFSDNGGAPQVTTLAVKASSILEGFDDGYATLIRSEPDGGTTLSTYKASTGAVVERTGGVPGYPDRFREGFLTISHAKAGSTLVAFRNTETTSHTLVQPPERVLRYEINRPTNRMLLRTVGATWRELSLSIIDLTTFERKVIYQPDSNTKLGAFGFSADGTRVVFTTSDWSGASSQLWLKTL